MIVEENNEMPKTKPVGEEERQGEEKKSRCMKEREEKQAPGDAQSVCRMPST